MSHSTNRPERDVIVCADCGLDILDTDDIEVTLDTDGNVTVTLHTDAFHRDMFPDGDEAYVSPFNVSPRFYAVTEHNTDDPDSTRTLIMSANEVRDTYPHWGGKATLVSRDGYTVTVEPVQP